MGAGHDRREQEPADHQGLHRIGPPVPGLDRHQGAAPFELGTLNRWVADALAAGRSGATARTRQLAVRRYAAWLLATGRVRDDPFRGVKTPKVEPPMVHPLTEDQVRALLRTCDVAADARPDLLLQHRRDEAIIRLMLETAIRKGEVTALELGDVDLDAGLVTIRRGKRGRGRVIPIGPFANRALRAYLRQRARHPLAATPPLWLGTRSRPMGYEGLHNTLRRRAQRAGIDGFHPHRLRHTAAHRWLAKGGSEAGLMAIAGWTRTDMLVATPAPTPPNAPPRKPGASISEPSEPRRRRDLAWLRREGSSAHTHVQSRARSSR